MNVSPPDVAPVWSAIYSAEQAGNVTVVAIEPFQFVMPARRQRRKPSTPIKPHRVVDQEPLLQGRRWGDPRNVIDQNAVVGCDPYVGMRPIGAPDDAVGEL